MGLFRWRRITEKVNVVVEHEPVLSIRFSHGASHANCLRHVSLCLQTKQAIGLHGNDFQPTSNARNDAMISETRRFAVHIKALHRDFLALERSIDGEFPTLSPQACMLERWTSIHVCRKPATNLPHLQWNHAVKSVIIVRHSRHPDRLLSVKASDLPHHHSAYRSDITNPHPSSSGSLPLLLTCPPFYAKQSLHSPIVPGHLSPSL